MKTKPNKRKNYLFSAFSKPPRHPLSVVIKSHRERDVIYITYGHGRKNGGGSWSEDLTKLNPRTMAMIKNYFPDKIYNALETTISTARSRRVNNERQANN